MELFVVRHEEAEDGFGVDEHRALTGRGRRRMHATARYLAQQVEGLDHVFSSPLVRAVQTAEILVANLGFDEPLEIAPELAGPTTFARLLELATRTTPQAERVALVGHEPILGALLGHCLQRPPVAVGRGEVFALELDRARSFFSFRFRIEPDGPRRIDTLER